MARHDIVVIGASAGGVEALTQVVHELPARLNAALLVVLHLPPDAPSVLPRILTRAGALPATNPGDGDPIEMGHIYIAPPDRHLLVERGFMRVSAGPREHAHRPAVDPLFRTAAHAYGPRVLGIVLSGNLNDGSAGLSEIVRAGGAAIVQLPEESLFPGMPRAAAEYVPEARRLAMSNIGHAIAQMAAAPAERERKVSTTADFTSRDAVSGPHGVSGVGNDPESPIE